MIILKFNRNFELNTIKSFWHDKIKYIVDKTPFIYHLEQLYHAKNRASLKRTEPPSTNVIRDNEVNAFNSSIDCIVWPALHQY